MQIEVINNDGCATVAVINPTTQECVSTCEVEPGQRVVATVENAHEASDIQVGEVHAHVAETGQEPGAPGTTSEPEPTPEPEAEPEPGAPAPE